MKSRHVNTDPYSQAAEILLSKVAPGMDTYSVQALIGAASARATFALVYEQRTANLIALLASDARTTDLLHAVAGRNFYPELAEEIFTRLNITKEN